MPRLVVIGASLGGSRVVAQVLGDLPRDFPAAVAIVQHRGAESGEEFIHILGRLSAMPLGEAVDKDAIAAGRVVVAPADYHLLVDGDVFALSTEAPVNYARPSIDVLFDSAAACFGRAACGVIFSGANRDGADGAARIKARGGMLIVQDPASAEVRTMPEAAMAATAVDKILRPSEIAPALVEWARAG